MIISFNYAQIKDVYSFCEASKLVTNNKRIDKLTLNINCKIYEANYI